MLGPGDRSGASGAGDTPERRHPRAATPPSGDTPERRHVRERRCPMRDLRGLRRLEAIYGLVAAIYGCAMTGAIAAAISSGTLPADKPGALSFQAVGFTPFLSVRLVAAPHR